MTNYEKEIKEIYQEYGKKNGIQFLEKDFNDFLEFLEIDFYAWVKENLRIYFRDKKSKR
jgi:hypothetical protein